MDYKTYSAKTCEYDEFILKSFYTTNPSLSSLQEVILMFLQELAYYLLELKKAGINNDEIKDNFIEALSGTITNVQYDDEQFKNIVLTLAKNLGRIKALYSDFCTENNVKGGFLKSNLKNAQNMSLNELIKKGEKHYISRNTDFSIEQKNLFDIIILLSKRICLKIIQIKSYKKDYENAYQALLTLINTLNFKKLSTTEIEKIIKENLKEYSLLITSLYSAQEEAHGAREAVHIPFSPRNGKAILVSGVDMTELETVLELTKDRGIDVYTHGMTMLMAHTLANFRKYPNLVGHFGKGSENSLFDFAAFPGAILMTKYLFQKIDYLYKGRLFTTDSFAPKGIIKITDNDYEPLIQAALKAKGFTKKQQERILQVGFKEQDIEDKINELMTKIEKNEIKHIYFIGILNQQSEYKSYFDKFLKIMPKNCFAISLSHDKNAENILHIDSFYDYLLIYKIFEKINKLKPISQFKITIFITKYDQYTISNIINFINLGIKSIYLGDCLPPLINPAMLDTLRKVFSIKNFSTPKEDLKKTLSE